MPLPLPTFEELLRVRNPLLEGIREGEQVRALRESNALRELERQYYGPEKESMIAERKAQIPLIEAQTRRQNVLADYPLLGEAGPLGQIAGAMYLGEKGGNILNRPIGDIQDLILKGVQTGIEQKGGIADYRRKQTQAYNYMSLPVDQKSQLLAQASGMGYDPTQATQLLMEGNSIQDLAKNKGLDPANLPTPVYPTTKTSLTQIQRRQQALSEINTLNPRLTEAIAPYMPKIRGLSPKQVADAIRGDNPDKQARFLAARALIPEMSALRLRAMGGNVGIEALREVTEKSMGNIRAFEPLVNENIYRKANQYVDKWLEEAVTRANEVGLGKYKPSEKEEVEQGEEEWARMIKPDGTVGRMPSRFVKSALKAGWKRG